VLDIEGKGEAPPPTSLSSDSKRSSSNDTLTRGASSNGTKMNNGSPWASSPSGDAMAYDDDMIDEFGIGPPGVLVSIFFPLPLLLLRLLFLAQYHRSQMNNRINSV
jgi:hypothetical protein